MVHIKYGKFGDVYMVIPNKLIINNNIENDLYMNQLWFVNESKIINRDDYVICVNSYGICFNSWSSMDKFNFLKTNINPHGNFIDLVFYAQEFIEWINKHHQQLNTNSYDEFAPITSDNFIISTSSLLNSKSFVCKINLDNKIMCRYVDNYLLILTYCGTISDHYWLDYDKDFILEHIICVKTYITNKLYLL